VTQHLIDAGALEGYMSDTDDPALGIRRMQWDLGVGTDCNGVVRAAFQELHRGKQPGDTPLGGGLYEEAPHWAKIEPEEARPGDIIKLADTGEDVGHNVMVENVVHVEDPSARRITGDPEPTGPLTITTVTSSWGAGGNPDYDGGGVRSEDWAYDQGTGKWGTFDEGSSSIRWSSTDGPYEHLMTGVFRSRDKVR
jgi:hypothetical protein